MTVLIVNSAEWGEDHARSNYPKDVGQWFVDGIGNPGHAYSIWRAQIEERPPVSDPEAVYLSGSSASVYDSDPWIARLSDAVRDWRERNVPILGVCFGHQLLAQALGGRVEKNPKGWEVGVTEVELTPEGRKDPLFESFPERFPVMQSHQDVVVTMPPGARLLARNEVSACQSFALGDRIHTVQFHPEYTPEHLRFLLVPRQEKLSASGLDMHTAMAAIRPTPESRSILKRFLQHFVESGVASGT